MTVCSAAEELWGEYNNEKSGLSGNWKDRFCRAKDDCKNKKWNFDGEIIGSCFCRPRLMMKRIIYNKKWQKIVG